MYKRPYICRLDRCHCEHCEKPKITEKGIRNLVFFLFLLFALSFFVPKANGQLISQEANNAYRNTLPRVSEKWLQEVFASRDLLIYSDSEIPPAYQKDGTVHDVHYNVSPSHPIGNAFEFPWKHTAGVVGGTAHSFKFVQLPKDASGRKLPIVWTYVQLQNVYIRGQSSPYFQGEPGYRWFFPIGTVVGEVMTIRSPEQEDYAFEVRTRTRDEFGWDVGIYRPFASSKELAKRIKELRPAWKNNNFLTTAVAQLEQERAYLAKITLQDSNHRSGMAFRASAAMDKLPSLDANLVKDLLTTTEFGACSGGYWKLAQDGTECYAPTTNQKFSVVPSGYKACVVALTRESCARCHQNTNHNVRKFQTNVEWYGTVRGSDGILSFHPFSAQCISHNGFRIPVRMNKRLEQAGVIARYDPRRHTDRYYTMITKE